MDLPAALAERFLKGQAVTVQVGPAVRSGPCRVYRDAGALLGVGEAGPGDELHPVRLLASG